MPREFLEAAVQDAFACPERHRLDLAGELDQEVPLVSLDRERRLAQLDDHLGRVDVLNRARAGDVQVRVHGEHAVADFRERGDRYRLAGFAEQDFILGGLLVVDLLDDDVLARKRSSSLP